MATELKLQVVLDAMDRITAPLKKIRGGAGEAGKELKSLRERLRGLNDTQKRIGEFRELSSGLANTGKDLRQAQSRVNALAAEMRSSAEPSARLRREFEAAKKTAQQLGRQHDTQRQKLQSVRSALGTAGISTKNLSQAERTLRTQIAGTNRQIDTQTERMNRLAQATRRTAEARRQFERSQAMAGRMAMAGAGAGAIGYGILRGGGSMMAEGMDFESTMSLVQARARLERDSAELKALREQARQLGATTTFTATDAASGQSFLAMAGFDPQAIRDAMPGVLDMSRAGGVDLGRGADIASNILSGFSLPASEMSRVADVLIQTATNSNTNLEMLGDTMKYVGPVATQFGMSLEEAAAMAGLLGNVGIQSSQAGTTMRAMMLRLAAPAGAARRELQALGLDAVDSAGNMRNIVDITADVARALDGLGSGDQLRAIKAIFGEEASAGMAELINQAGSGGITSMLGIVEQHQGVANRVSQTMADNLKGDLAQLGSAWADVKITLFDDNAGALRETTKLITEMVQALGSWAKQNPELVSTITKVVAIIGVLAAAFSGVALALAGVLVPMAAVKFAFTSLGIQAAGAFGAMRSALPAVLSGIGALRGALPMVLASVRAIGVAVVSSPVGLALAAIATAALLIYRYWDPIKAFFGGLFAGISQAVAPVGEALSSALDAVSPLASVFGLLGDGISAVLGWLSRLIAPVSMSSEALDGVAGSGQRVGEIIGRVFRVLLAPIEIFAKGIQAVALLITGQWQGLGDMFRQTWQGAIATMQALPGQFGEIGGRILEGLKAGIASGAAAVWEEIKGVAAGIKSWFCDILGISSPSRVFMTYGGDLISGLVNGVRNGLGAAVQGVKELASAISGAASEGFAGLKSIAADALDAVSNKASSAWGSIKDKVGSWWRGDDSPASDQPHPASRQGSDPGGGAPAAGMLANLRERVTASREWLATAWDNATASAGAAVRAIDTELAGMAENTRRALADSGAAATAGMAQLGRALERTGAGLRSAMRTAFGGALQWMEGLPERFSTMGSQLVQGLIRGIQSMASSLKQSIVGIGQRAGDWFADKLGIRSPSRVFVEYGREIPAGASLGIERGAGQAIGAMRGLAAAVAAVSLSAPAVATATPAGPELRAPGIAANAESTPAARQPLLLRPQLEGNAARVIMAQMQESLGEALVRARGVAANIATDIEIDTRPALASRAAPAQVNYGGDTVNIHIHPAPGSDAQAIARAVSAELDRRERAREARRRSAMTDYGA